MAESALGRLLKKLREDQGLSLREVANRAGVDHAYVYRLETGDKEAPSEEVLTKLIGALSPTQRDIDLLRYFASHVETDMGLVDFAAKDQSVTIDEFSMLKTVVSRGARPDYATSLARIRRFMREEEDG